MTLGEIIKQYRDKTGLSRNRFAEMCGLSRSYVGALEKDYNPVTGKSIKPSMDVVERVAKVTGMDLNYLVDLLNDKAPKRPDENVELASFTPEDYTLIPVYGSVPAGVPIEAIQDIIGSVPVKKAWADTGNYFALRVQGDSMYPYYMQGDKIIVRKQPDCESGEDAVVYIDNYNATLKTVIKNDDGTITLKPINPIWQPQTYDPRKTVIRIAGIVVQVVRER